jgi:hypothetical protein
MTAIGGGEIFPQTHTEQIAALLVIIIGATTYAGLFGTFAVLIDDLNATKQENM